MAMNDLPPELWPISVAGVLNLALGVLLMTLDINHRANRAFATVMILRAGSHLNFGLVAMLPDEATAIRRTFIPIGLCILAALTYFLCLYPRPRAWLPRGRAAPILFAGPALAATVVAMAWAREWFAPLEAEGFLLVTVGASALFGAAALVLLQAAIREPPGLTRTSTLLMSIGFTAVAMQDLVGTYLTGALRPGGPSTPLLHGVGALWVGVAIVQLALVLRHGRHRFAQVQLGVIVLAVAVAVGTQLVARDSIGPVGLTLGAGIARLLLPLLMAYALLRFQVFDLDVRFRRGFGLSLVPTAFVLLFFAVSEAAERVVSARLGTVFGILAALVLLFAVKPLERWSERFSRTVLPGVRRPEELDASAREALYRDLARTAWSDGIPSAGERRVLDAARARLRVAAARASRIERQVAPA